MAVIRVAWGPEGIDLIPADVVVVVDVLSFSTCVEIAVSRGVAVFPSDGAIERPVDTIVAGRRGRARYSLSPASFLDAPDGLRCVLPSPNGATIAARARAKRCVVIAGCLRNASAVAAAAPKLGKSFTVIAAGEIRHDGSRRPALEDWLGAGSILRALPGPRDPVTESAVAAFERHRDNLRNRIASTASGRELIGRGHAIDVDLAAELDVGGAVPVLGEDGAFRGIGPR